MSDLFGWFTELPQTIRRLNPIPEMDLKMTDEQLHIESAAMQFSDTRAQQRHDLRVALSRGAHFVGLTEIDNDVFRMDARAACKEKGYRLAIPENTHSPIAVHRSVQLLHSTYDQVIPASSGDSGGGRHGHRGITTATGLWKGNTVSLHWTHWLTNWNDANRYRQNIQLTQALIGRVRATGGGNHLAFWGGDINWDKDDKSKDTPGKLLRNSGLIVAYDELGREDLGTHGRRTIDLIGSYKADGRVSPAKLRLWSDSVVPTFTDHKQVSVWFNVKPLPEKEN